MVPPPQRIECARGEGRVLSVQLLLLALLLGLSAYFSGAETALFSLRSPQLARLRQGSSRSARAVLSLLQRPRSILATVLIGNTLVNVLVSVVAAGQFVIWFELLIFVGVPVTVAYKISLFKYFTI